MVGQKKWRIDIKWIVILAIVAFLLIFEVFPLFYLLIKSLFSGGSFSWEAYRRVYTYDLNWIALKNTILTAGFTTILGVAIAFPLAFLVGRTDMYGKKFFRTLFVVTYMVPPYVGAMAWLRLLNPNAGVLNRFLMKIFGLGTAPFNIYTTSGIVWVLTCFFYPYAFITISRAMEKMDPSLEEASRISGASPLKTLLKVTIPMMTPSIIAAGLLVFVASASSYGIPSIIGAPGQIYTVTMRIIDFVHIGSEEGLTDAMTLAVFLMLISNIILYISTFVVGRKQYITMSGKSTRPNIVELGKWRLPITIIISTTNSFLAATAAAFFGILISCVMAYLLQRTNVKGKRIPDFLITLGSGTPSVTIALALIISMSGKFGINIYNTLTIMIIAYMIKYMLMGMRTVVSAMSQVHPSLEEAAQISGANWLRMLKDVTLPLIAASIVAGIFLIFMPSFYELTMSTLLYSSNTKTIGYELYIYQTYHSQQVASALATAILLFVILVNYILNKLTKGQFSI